MLSLYKVLDIPSELVGGVFTPDSNLTEFSYTDGSLKTNTYDLENSTWPNPMWVIEEQDTNLIKSAPQAFAVDNFMDLMTSMAYSDGEFLYMHYSPDYGGYYDPKAPYRLYYAHDTDKVYQNVMDEWLFVATKDHMNLINAGQLTHDEIDTKIAQLEQLSGGFQEFEVEEW